MYFEVVWLYSQYYICFSKFHELPGQLVCPVIRKTTRLVNTEPYYIREDLPLETSILSFLLFDASFQMDLKEEVHETYFAHFAANIYRRETSFECALTSHNIRLKQI